MKKNISYEKNKYLEIFLDLCNTYESLALFSNSLFFFINSS